MNVSWDYCHTCMAVTTLVEGAEQLGCGCDVPPSSRPTKATGGLPARDIKPIALEPGERVTKMPPKENK